MTTNDGSELIEALIAQLRSSQRHLERLLDGGSLVPADLTKAWPSSDQAWSELLAHVSGAGSVDLTKLQSLLPTPEQLQSLLPDIDASSPWPWPVASTPSPWPAPKRPATANTENTPPRSTPSPLRRQRGPGARPTPEPTRSPTPRRGSAYDEPDDAATARQSQSPRRPATTASNRGLRRAPRRALTDAPMVEPMVGTSKRVTDAFDAHDRLDHRSPSDRKIHTGPHLHDRDDPDDPEEGLELVPSMQDAAMEGESFSVGPPEAIEKTSTTPRRPTHHPRGTRDIVTVTEQLMNGERP